MTTKKDNKKVDVPKRGDRVRLRGREPHGVLKTIDDEMQWCVVEWSSDSPGGPKYVHLRELEVIA